MGELRVSRLDQLKQVQKSSYQELPAGYSLYVVLKWGHIFQAIGEIVIELPGDKCFHNQPNTREGGTPTSQVSCQQDNDI